MEIMNIHKIKGSYNRRTTSYLRYHATNEWKEECFRKANNTCEITGRRGKSTLRLVVHHANESFLSISKRVHRELGVRYHDCIDDYKPEDLQAVVNGIKEAHQTCIGVVITEDMHTILHQKFTNPTYEDYKQFKKAYRRNLYQRKNNSYRKVA